jgi:hypothetical protein
MLAGDVVDGSRVPLLPGVAVTVRIGSPYTIISANPVFVPPAEVMLNVRLVIVLGEGVKSALWALSNITPAPSLLKFPTATDEPSLKLIIPVQT